MFCVLLYLQKLTIEYEWILAQITMCEIFQFKHVHVLALICFLPSITKGRRLMPQGSQTRHSVQVIHLSRIS